MRLVYLCSPYRGDYETNIRLAKQYCKMHWNRVWLRLRRTFTLHNFILTRFQSRGKLGWRWGSICWKSQMNSGLWERFTVRECGEKSILQRSITFPFLCAEAIGNKILSDQHRWK